MDLNLKRVSRNAQAQDDLIVRTARDAGFSETQWRAMFFETGPYDITVPTVALSRFAELLLERAKQGAQ